MRKVCDKCNGTKVVEENGFHVQCSCDAPKETYEQGDMAIDCLELMQESLELEALWDETEQSRKDARYNQVLQIDIAIEEVVKLQAEHKELKEKYNNLKHEVQYVVNDMPYKSPEMAYEMVVTRWCPTLKNALGDKND